MGGKQSKEKEGLEFFDIEQASFEEEIAQGPRNSRPRDYGDLLSQNVVSPTEDFECSICLTETSAEDGIMLKECLHEFCMTCIAHHVEHSESVDVKCPFSGGYRCQSTILEHEIKELVSQEVYQKYLQKGLQAAEMGDAEAHHCHTPDCGGFCFPIQEFFTCPVCKMVNCVPCKTIHEGQTCKEYKKSSTKKKKEEKLATKKLKDLVAKGKAMHCPGCTILIEKNGGCDFIRCTACKMEICWPTRGPRYGPNGCGCTVEKRCHPSCEGCHSAYS